MPSTTTPTPMPTPTPMLTAPLTPAKATLLAASLAAGADLARLRVLIGQYPAVFTPETVLRVLLVVPETSAPAAYTPLLEAILAGEPLGAGDASLQLDTSSVATLSGKKAKRQLRLIPALPPLQRAPSGSYCDTGASTSTGTGTGAGMNTGPNTGTITSTNADTDTKTDTMRQELVAAFLAARAELIDAETGALSIAVELLQAFSAVLPAVRQLLVGSAQPLHKLVYEFVREPAPGLAAFRALPAEEALEVLIADPDTVVRDLQELVEPYLSVRDAREWAHVWARLSALPFARLVAVLTEWTPPAGVRADWARWAMRVCYRCPETDPDAPAWLGLRSVGRRIAELLLLPPPGPEPGPEGGLPARVGDLADRENPLAVPSRATLGLLDAVITSSALLGRTMAETLRIRLEGSPDIQHAVLRHFVRPGPDWSARDDAGWQQIRSGARWLQRSGALARLATEDVERAVLAGMLEGTRFGLARDTYAHASSGPLPPADVEKCVLAAFHGFVDNATNGNKTRGQMKHALQTIRTVYPHTLRTPALRRADALVSAIHALSTFHLPATHQAPLLPVHIRIHPDPLSLISKLLAANPRSYLNPDGLTTIARDLVSGTGRDSVAAAVPEQVLGMCAEAALGEDDFETAYASITSRLLPRAADSADARSTLWRTALLAGRFDSSYAALAGPPASLGPAVLRLLEQKRELLALALAHCPAEAAPDVLAQWRHTEDDIEAALEREERADEEHARLAGGGGAGGGGRRASVSREGEAPQSLFEVARGAARVFSSSRGGGGGGGDGGSESHAAKERKRDIVGGMVTRGLAGGLGWVLGAQPNIDTHQGR